MKLSLPPDLSKAVEAALDGWQANGKVERLWALRALWTDSGEASGAAG